MTSVMDEFNSERNHIIDETGKLISEEYFNKLMLQEKTMLQEAEELTSNTRMKLRGHPIDNFHKIAGVWSALLGIPLSSMNVAIMMTVLKLVRQWDGYDPDNELDTAGYANNQRQIVDELKRRLEVQEGEELEATKAKLALLIKQVGL
jgi:hypothetical protein